MGSRARGPYQGVLAGRIPTVVPYRESLKNAVKVVKKMFPPLGPFKGGSIQVVCAGSPVKWFQPGSKCRLSQKG
jgi:hypothetical protein